MDVTLLQAERQSVTHANTLKCCRVMRYNYNASIQNLMQSIFNDLNSYNIGDFVIFTEQILSDTKHYRK